MMLLSCQYPPISVVHYIMRQYYLSPSYQKHHKVRLLYFESGVIVQNGGHKVKNLDRR